MPAELHSDEQRWLLDVARQVSSPPPVDVLALALGFGIRVVRARKSPRERRRGELVDRDGQLVIRVLMADTSRRATRTDRFTIAHELGHALLMKRFSLHQPLSRAGYWKHEGWCDDFAGHLLVPDDALAAYAVDRAAESILEIADACEVTPEPAALRLATAQPNLTIVALRHSVANASNIVVKWAAPRDVEGLHRASYIPSSSPLGQAFLQRPMGTEAKSPIRGTWRTPLEYIAVVARNEVPYLIAGTRNQT